MKRQTVTVTERSGEFSFNYNKEFTDIIFSYEGQKVKPSDSFTIFAPISQGSKIINGYSEKSITTATARPFLCLLLQAEASFSLILPLFPISNK